MPGGWLCDATGGHPHYWHPGFHIVPLDDQIIHLFNKRCPCGPVNIRPFVLDETFGPPVESGMWMHTAQDGRAYVAPESCRVTA